LNRQPDQKQIKKRKAIWNSPICNKIDFIDESKEVRYYENENENERWQENRDFVYVASIQIRNKQSEFLKYDKRRIQINSVEGVFEYGNRTIDYKKYILFGLTIKELLIQVHVVIQVHAELNDRFSQMLDSSSDDFLIENIHDLYTLDRRYYRSLGTNTLEIYPNSRCCSCLKPINQLLEKCNFGYTPDGYGILCGKCSQITVPNNDNYFENDLVSNENPYQKRLKAYREGHKGIHWSTVGPKDNWLCHLCNEKVEPDAKIGSGQGPTIDHVIPISKGGKHEWENVKLAHRSCNSAKSNRPMRRKYATK
jgi:5-methylcytosine-specific restriction endonuclease McrA